MFGLSSEVYCFAKALGLSSEVYCFAKALPRRSFIASFDVRSLCKVAKLTSDWLALVCDVTQSSGIVDLVESRAVGNGRGNSHH